MNTAQGHRTVTLYGYRYSVYLRVVRMVMVEKGVAWRHVEVDPFVQPMPSDYLKLNPFGRVPTLVDGSFVLYETAAIARYVDEAFDGPALQPSGVRDRARMAQVIAVMDSYGYWPMVRQVFSHRVFRPAAGETSDETEIAAGLAKAGAVMAAYEDLSDGEFLVGRNLSLADLHVAPMIAYFTAAPEGERLISQFPTIAGWWTRMKRRPSLIETDPGLPA